MRPISTQLKDMTGGVTTGGRMGFPSKGDHGHRSKLRTSSYFFFRFLHEIIFLGVRTLPSFLFFTKTFPGWLLCLKLSQKDGVKYGSMKKYRPQSF